MICCRLAVLAINLSIVYKLRSKLVALQYHFKENNFDYIFYLDMDGIIMNQELKLETIIDATERKYDFIVTSDQYGIGHS